MKSASSMYNEIKEKSIRTQISTNNGNVLKQQKQKPEAKAKDIFSYTLPKRPSIPTLPKLSAEKLFPFNIGSSDYRKGKTTLSSKQSFCFYVASSVFLALCYFTAPSIAAEIASHPLPL